MEKRVVESVERVIKNATAKRRQQMEDLVYSTCPAGLIDGDPSVYAAWFMALALNHGQVYLSTEHTRHAFLRMRYAGSNFDCDFHADFIGHTEPARTEYADEMFADAVPMASHRLSEADFDILEKMAHCSGPDVYGSMVPEIRKLRLKVRKERDTLA